jgi:glycosyltransferase involved in cell wall biosynthesis
MRVVIVGSLPESLLNFRGDFLKELVVRGHEVIALADEASQEVIQDLKGMGISFYSFPIQRNGMNPLTDLKTFFALRNHFRELKPDLVMAYTIKPIIWGGLALRSMPKIRFYALVTGLGFVFQGGGGIPNFLMLLVSVFYRTALNRASRAIFQNTDNRDEFIRRKIISASCCSLVNGSGVNLSRFAQSPVPNKDCVFITISRLVGYKGIREYAAAASIVKKCYPEIMFKLIGPEDPQADGIPISEIHSWHEQGWVEYCGAADDVRPFLNACSVYVLPSYHEGMPRSVLEAMSVGRPILTTDVSGCRETVVSGENGFLVPKADAGALAERMIWFVENQDLLQKMGDRSRQLAEERFDVRMVNNKLISILGLKAIKEVC